MGTNSKDMPADQEREKTEKSPKWSIRSTSWIYFGLGYTPKETAAILHEDERKIYRYHYDWKRVPRYRAKYQIMKEEWRSMSPREKDIFARLLAIALGASVKSVRDLLMQPWSVKRLATGEWKEWYEPGSRRQLSLKEKAEIWFILKMFPNVESLFEWLFFTGKEETEP